MTKNQLLTLVKSYELDEILEADEVFDELQSCKPERQVERKFGKQTLNNYEDDGLEYLYY